MDSDEWFDASVGCYTSALLCDTLAMPLLPDLWDSAHGGILDLVTLGCQLSVYIWLLLPFGAHVLAGYGLVTLRDFLQLVLLCVVITLLSGIVQELRWHGDLLRAHGVKLDILIQPAFLLASSDFVTELKSLLFSV